MSTRLDELSAMRQNRSQFLQAAHDPEPAVAYKARILRRRASSSEDATADHVQERLLRARQGRAHGAESTARHQIELDAEQASALLNRLHARTSAKRGRGLAQGALKTDGPNLDKLLGAASAQSELSELAALRMQRSQYLQAAHDPEPAVAYHVRLLRRRRSSSEAATAAVMQERMARVRLAAGDAATAPGVTAPGAKRSDVSSPEASLSDGSSQEASGTDGGGSDDDNDEAELDWLGFGLELHAAGLSTEEVKLSYGKERWPTEPFHVEHVAFHIRVGHMPY